MASIKLTKDIKHTIKIKMTNELFKAKLDSVDAEIGAEAYKMLMTPQIQALPQFLIDDEWIQTTSEVEIQRVGKNGNYISGSYFTMPGQVPIKKGYSYSPSVNIRLDTNLGSDLAVLYLLRERIRNESRQFDDKLDSLLAAVTTSAQLAELFPEAIKYIPELASANNLIPLSLVKSLRDYFPKAGENS